MKFSSIPIASTLLSLLVASSVTASPLRRRDDPLNGRQFGLLALHSGNEYVHLHGFYVGDSGSVYLDPADGTDDAATFTMSNGQLSVGNRYASVSANGEIVFKSDTNSTSSGFSVGEAISSGYSLKYNGTESAVACPSLVNNQVYQVFFGVGNGNPSCVGIAVLAVLPQPISSSSTYNSTTSSYHNSTSTPPPTITSTKASTVTSTEATTVTTTTAVTVTATETYTVTATNGGSTITSTGASTVTSTQPSTVTSTQRKNTATTTKTTTYVGPSPSASSVVAYTTKCIVVPVITTAASQSEAATPSPSAAVYPLFPHGIRLIDSTKPEANSGNVYSPVVFQKQNNHTNTIFRFDVPQVSGSCELNFHLDTSGFPITVEGVNGTGRFILFNLSSVANDSTVYSNRPNRIAEIGRFNCSSSGCDYATNVTCPDSYTAVSYEMMALTDDSYLSFFEEADPLEGLTLRV
ncbi:But2 family protein [Schizosaccharomyces pombe]